jgi:hypothetical protein
LGTLSRPFRDPFISPTFTSGYRFAWQCSPAPSSRANPSSSPSWRTGLWYFLIRQVFRSPGEFAQSTRQTRRVTGRALAKGTRNNTRPPSSLHTASCIPHCSLDRQLEYAGELIKCTGAMTREGGGEGSNRRAVNPVRPRPRQLLQL